MKLSAKADIGKRAIFLYLTTNVVLIALTYIVYSMTDHSYLSIILLSLIIARLVAGLANMSVRIYKEYKRMSNEA